MWFEPWAAVSGSKYANHCGILPPPMLRSPCATISLLSYDLFQALLSQVELRKIEMQKELDSHFNAKKMAMDAYRQKAVESMDNLQEVSLSQSRNSTKSNRAGPVPCSLMLGTNSIEMMQAGIPCAKTV